MRNANEVCIQGTKAQRVALPAPGRLLKGSSRIDAGARYGFAMCVMPLTTTSSAIVTGPSNADYTREQRRRSVPPTSLRITDNRIATDVYIVSDPHLVIDLDAVADHRVADRATVNGGPCSDRNVIAKTN